MLDEETLKSKTKAYNPLFLCSKHITHIKDTAILPFDCYPNVNRPDGEYKDNLHKFYIRYFNQVKKINSYLNETEMDVENDTKYNEMNSDMQKIKGDIVNEIKERWKGGKNGRWRQDICGKRCNFTARSVLSPNPNLKLTQVGLPLAWKTKLTLQEIFGPGANETYISIVEDNGKMFHTKYRKPQIGDRVLRELKDNELVLVNRQPTLRDSNFVAMEIVWITQNTVQMHPGLFSMFDADCDGDEVNIHIPQIPQNELLPLHIKHSIINLADMGLSPSVIQDAVIGLCLHCGFKNKSKIHEKLLNNLSLFEESEKILQNMHNLYRIGCHNSYLSGFSVGFDFKEVDYMIDVGAKGKSSHKEKIRSMFKGIYDNHTHFEDCKSTRLAVMSTSLKTAETGYISRRLAYHLDDVIQDENGLCMDYGKTYIQYPTGIPTYLHDKPQFGLYLVSSLMPPLTQKMLDSFHAASVGESIENHTGKFDSLINCSSPELLEIYSTKGILYTKKWLKKSIIEFFGENVVSDFWIQFLVDFLCVTGRPIGVGISKLGERMKQYAKFNTETNVQTFPILKYTKFGNPHRNILNAAKQNIHDDLKSNHSREVFF